MDGHENGSAVADAPAWADVAPGRDAPAREVDPEIERLSTVITALNSMEDGERRRALNLIAAKYKDAPATGTGTARRARRG